MRIKTLVELLERVVEIPQSQNAKQCVSVNPCQNVLPMNSVGRTKNVGSTQLNRAASILQLELIITQGNSVRRMVCNFLVPFLTLTTKIDQLLTEYFYGAFTLTETETETDKDTDKMSRYRTV